MDQQFLNEQTPIKDDKNPDMKTEAKSRSPPTFPFQLALSRCQLERLPLHDQQTLLDGFDTLNSLREQDAQFEDTEKENIDTQSEQAAYDTRDVDWDQAMQDGPELWQLLE
ncbi:hypothetical protein INT43_008032 [Umbelopsis isabellina]|uniref:Uncharacterized protein n=1 Tax=Mortierella isabellina TaxID=91625 RepID=A0A8H7PPD3_MORIS|nr:hypothetical protein INT43_008032 [Umbelopsis isabellina]